MQFKKSCPTDRMTQRSVRKEKKGSHYKKESVRVFPFNTVVTLQSTPSIYSINCTAYILFSAYCESLLI